MFFIHSLTALEISCEKSWRTNHRSGKEIENHPVSRRNKFIANTKRSHRTDSEIAAAPELS